MRSVFFTANETIEGKLAGVPCRFRASRHYEISTRPKNATLLAEIERLASEGKLTMLDDTEGRRLVDEQGEADRARRRAARAAAGPNVDAPAAKASATIKSEG